MAKKQAVLVAKNISLTYEIKVARNNKTRWTKLSSAIIGHKKTIHALEDMSFQLNSGEIIGLVGDAGSGKSSLLETLGGAAKPNTGEIWAVDNPVLLNGSLAFFGQLSGSENIRLALLSMGVNKLRTTELSKEIVEAAKVKKIVHNPISSYSGTTKKKLMAEVAFAQNPRLLLIDQRIKLRGIQERTEFEDRIKSLAKAGCCIVMVGLPTAQIARLCTRMIWLDKGKIKEDGTVNRVLPLFRNRKK
jgi:ABC-type polysaccharide/polyol phosphate transport system ATPase subunit